MNLLPASALALACALATPLTAQKHLRAAEKHFELGAFAEAIPGYERHVRKSPGDAAGRARLAHAYRMTGRLEAAAEEYAVLADADPDPESAFRYALTLMELGRYGAAVEQLGVAQQLGYPGVGAVATRLEYAQRNAREASTWEVANEFANSPADDYAPSALGDGVVFASAREGGGARLYRSTRDENGFLRAPEPLHGELSEATGDAPAAYGPSGQLVAFTRNTFDPGERFLPEAGWELHLQLATADDAGDFAGGKSFPYNGPGFSTGFAAFAPDGKSLYFASDRPGGHGGYDLYVSRRTTEGWGEPVNLGPRVNTPGHEITPSAVEGAIYFASDYHPGYGGMDVYRADFVGDDAAAIVNLGVGVNGPLDDVGFVTDPGGEYAYFASNRPGGRGGLDLYRARRSGTGLRIEVVDAKSGRPVPNAVLNLTDCGQGKFLTGVDGVFSFRVLTTESCRPTIVKPGYEPKTFTLDAKRLREGRGFKLRLNPEDRVATYTGQVVNSRTGEPIAGARVEARQANGPYLASAVTDAEGRYALDLEPSRDYVIAYSARAMATIDREVSVGTSGGGDDLASFAMFPSSPPVEAPADATAAAAPPLERLSEASGPASRAESGAAPGAASPEWAVQVAALPLDATDISAYRRRLAGYGRVYGKREDGVLRVRVGPFATRSEAVAILADVRDEGYADAFPAEEAGGGVYLGEAPHAPDRASVAAAAPSPAPPVTAQPEGTYLIRLATYGDFANFDAGSVAGLGALTTRRSGENGEYVIVLLKGYADRSDAESRVAAAREAGFEDAHVVRELPDGTLRKL